MIVRSDTGERYIEVEQFAKNGIAQDAACRTVDYIAIETPQEHVSIPDQPLIVERLTQRPFKNSYVLEAKPPFPRDRPAPCKADRQLGQIHIPVDTPAGKRRLEDDAIQRISDVIHIGIIEGIGQFGVKNLQRGVVEIMRVPDSHGAVDPDRDEIEIDGMADLQSGAIKIASRERQGAAEVFVRIPDRIGVNEFLGISRRQDIELVLFGVIKPETEPMSELLIHIGQIVVELELPGITGDQPGGELVVTPGKIEMGEFAAIIDPAETIAFLSPFRKVPVHRFQIGQGKNVPAFFHVDAYVGYVSMKFFDIDDHLVKKPGIDKPVVRVPEGSDKVAEIHRIAGLEGKFPQDDIASRRAVAFDVDPPDDAGD